MGAQPAQRRGPRSGGRRAGDGRRRLVRRPAHVATVGRTAAAGRDRPGVGRARPSCCCSTSRWPTSTSATSTRSSLLLGGRRPTSPSRDGRGGRPRPQPAALGADRRRVPPRRPRRTTARSATWSTRSCSPTSTARAIKVVTTPQGDLFTRSGDGAPGLTGLLADVGYQSDWIDILQTLVHAQRVHRRHARGDRLRARRLLRRRPPETRSPLTRWPTSAFPAPPARDPARRCPSPWASPCSASAAGWPSARSASG